MASDIRLRPYRPQDMARLLELEDMCFAPLLRFDRDMMRSLVECARSSTWVAEDSDNLAGFVIAELKTQRRAPLGYLVTIEVAPEYQRQKIASRLLDQMERTVANRGAGAMVLHVAARNHAAIRLYEKHGYAQVGAEECFYSDAGDALIYRKVLTESARSGAL